MSDFAGIESAKTSDRLPYFEEGSYVAQFETGKRFDSRNKGRMAVSEYIIIEATEGSGNKVGERVSYLIKITGNDSALGNIKGVVAGIAALPQHEVQPSDAEEMFPLNPASNFAHPAQGTKVKVDAVNVITKAGKPFTALRFSPYTASATAAPVTGETSGTEAPKGKAAKTAAK